MYIRWVGSGSSSKVERRVSGRPFFLTDVRGRSAIAVGTKNALNWLSGSRTVRASERRAHEEPQASQVAARALDLSAAWVSRRSENSEDADAPCCTSEAALHRLLKGRDVYDGGAGPNSLAPCSLPRISLPTDVWSAPNLVDRVPPDVLPFLLGYQERMLRTQTERDMIAPSDRVKPYIDPVLRRNRRVLLRLVKRLIKIGLFRVSVRPKGHVGIFFVHKSKGGKIRLILDCRPSNQMFTAPPSTPLATVESMCNIELDGIPADGVRLFVGVSDIDNCFHRLRLPESLSDWFCLDIAFTAKELGVSGQTIDGVLLHDDSPVSAASWMAPMGFSWSLHFAQRTSEYLFSQSLGSDSVLFNDETAPLILDPEPVSRFRTAHYVYVANLGLLSFDEGTVSSKLSQAVADFTRAGLQLHETSSGSGDQVALGSVLACDRFHTRLTTKRFWNLRLAISGFLRRKKVSGKALEVLLGHMTFAALANRWTLSVFNTVYRFVREFYVEAAEMWNEVRQELYAFRGLMIYLQADWSVPVFGTVFASDSSEAGWAFTSAEWPEADIARVCRVRERARFKKLFSRRARHSALLQAGLGEYLPELGERETWDMDESFDEVPARLLVPSRWRLVRSGAWLYDEHIVKLEAMGLNRVVSHLCSLPDVVGKRVLLLNDSMAVVLAFGRCRARSYGLLKEVRRAAAACLALGLRLHVRWVPSELNSSDEGTRHEGLGVAASKN